MARFALTFLSLLPAELIAGSARIPNSPCLAQEGWESYGLADAIRRHVYLGAECGRGYAELKGDGFKHPLPR